MTFSAELRLDEPQLRIAESDAGAALGAIVGKPVVVARTRLRFGPGRTCETLARVLDRGIIQAENQGLDSAVLVVAAGTARAGEDIVRVRRNAYGIADWIRSPTSRIAIVLRPAGLYDGAATGSTELSEPQVLAANSADAPADDAFAQPSDERATAVREALMEVIDPDLGVNIVDLGFVRTVVFEGRTPIITMTLTSAACPLTAVIESQIRSSIATLACVDDFRVDWQWIPAWRPSEITDSGREQLRAIGFTI